MTKISEGTIGLVTLLVMIITVLLSPIVTLIKTGARALGLVGREQLHRSSRLPLR